MKRALLLFSATLFLAFPLCVHAKSAKEAGQPKEAQMSQYNTITAKVVGINKTNHTLTLENDLGERHEIQVDPSQVKNFKQINVGDLVVVRESQSLALSLTKHKKGEKPEAAAAMEMTTAPAGAKPGLETAKAIQISAEVVRVDTANQTVDLKGPEGNIVQLRAKDPQRLEGLKKGDMVSATYTRALAISVEPAPAK